MKYDLLTAGSQHLDELTIDLNSLWWDRVKSYHLNMKTDLYYKWTKTLKNLKNFKQKICQNSMHVIRYQPIPSLVPSIP